MRLIFAVVTLVSLAAPATAQVPLSAEFIADAACPAFQSISRQTNPGNVTLRPGQSYDLVAANKADPTHFQLVIPGASPDRRWVEITCGRSTARLDVAAPTNTTAPSYRGTQYVLAVNWQPAFCENSPGKRECRSQSPSSFEASNFTLHGLWPQPRGNEYCGVSDNDRWASQDGDWRDLPELRLSAGLRRDLDEVMPGSLSALDRHEWTKHGTCYSTSAEDYYADALDLMLALNTSEVAELFAGNIGRRITLRQVREAFDTALGIGAGQRVSMDCAPDGNRTIITELTIALTGEITGPDDMAGLIAAADPTDGGCGSGIVDPVGLR